MGIFFSKTRKPKDELESIVLRLEKLSSRCGQIQRSRSHFLWWLSVLAFFVSSTFSAMVYASKNYDEPRIVYVGVAWVSIFLLFFGIRFLTFRLCNVILQRHERNIHDLKTRKSEIIESVKENEKFKVAKAFIEKYGSPEDMAELLPMNQSEMSDKRDNTSNGKRQFTLDGSSIVRDPDATIAARSMTHQGDQTAASIRTEPRPGAMNRAFFTPAIRRQPIRPYIQPSRTPIDKIIDYIVGDGPSSRFALICSHCNSHNGMSLPEEFKNMSFICFHCGMFNPARNSRASFTPKRAITHKYPDASKVNSELFIRTATNSESSESESGDGKDENQTDKQDTDS